MGYQPFGLGDKSKLNSQLVDNIYLLELTAKQIYSANSFPGMDDLFENIRKC